MGKGKNRQVRRDRRKERRQQNQEPDYETLFEPTRPAVDPKKSKPLEAKNEAQGHMITSILSKDITLVTGPAGTGKTYISATLALEELLAGRIEWIVVTRPMQSCDEDMGMLPGEIEDKFGPWVEPIMDVFSEHMKKGALDYALKSGKIQFKPLQYMRGKSWKNTWVILDEAQNTTPGQMKMFLTRIGENSKLIIDGDLRQPDLKDGRGVMQQSGLDDAWGKLKGIPEIGRVTFTKDDIVRHGLVRKILDRYEP